MYRLRTLFVGTVASISAVSGAFAADLPRKQEAIQYMKVCSTYGPGFFYLPGSDTCFKISGFVRVDSTINGGVYDQPAYSGDLGQQNRFRHYFSARSRMGLSFDSRTATEYGLLRTFAYADFQFTTLGNSSNNPNSVIPLAAVAQLDIPGGGYVAVAAVFMQFAGFTLGKSASAYATPWHGYPGNNSSYLMGGHDSVTGVNNIQYTAQFGNGVTATVGLDDPTVYNRTTVHNIGPSGAGISALSGIGQGIFAYAGTRAPDIVGRLRIDQDWGLFQISAAAHEVSGSFNILAPASGSPTNLSEISGYPDSKWGGAVMAALQIKNLPTGAKDDIKLDASYAVGETKQVVSTSGLSPNFAMFGGSSVAYQSIGLGVTTDAIWLPVTSGGDGQLKLTKAWGVRGAFNHNWDTYWSTSLYGGYTSVSYSGAVGDLTTAKGVYCAAFALGHPGLGVTYTCDPNFSTSQLGVVTRWTPFKDLAFSAGVQWFHLDQKMGNGPGLTTSTSTFSPGTPKPTAVYAFGDQNAVSVNVRVQRNF